MRATPIFGPPKRQRRRIPWWLIPVAVVLGLAVLAGNLRSETRELVAYFDAAGPLLEGQEAMSQTFESLVREDFQTIEREDFTTLIGAMKTDIASVSDELAAMQLPDAAVVTDTLLHEALNAWDTGLEDFENGVLAAADDPISPSPVDQIREAIIQLSVGDAIYARFHENSEVLRADLDVAIAAFPAIAYAKDQPALGSADLVARFIRTSSSLGVRSDIGILSVVFDPAPTGGETTDGAAIFPEADSMVLQATVANVGNQDEEGIVLRVTLWSASGALVAEETSAEIGLAAEDATALSFGPLPLIPGQRYRLFLDVDATPDEVLLDNNRIEKQFLVSEPG